MTGMTRQAFTLLNDVLLLGQQPQSTGQGRHQPMDPTAQSGLFLFAYGGHDAPAGGDWTNKQTDSVQIIIRLLNQRHEAGAFLLLLAYYYKFGGSSCSSLLMIISLYNKFPKATD